MEEKIEGVLLRTIPYLGSARILKIFTREEGLLSLMAKGTSRKWAALTTPFCLAEWVFKRGKEEMGRFKEGTLLDPLSGLKSRLETLLAAGSMAKDLLNTQLPAKRGDMLYTLFCSYLKKLPHFARPEVLSVSFQLKLLLWEGLLNLHAPCLACPAPARTLFGGENYCPVHAPVREHLFEEEEWQLLQILATARSLSALAACRVSSSFKEKVALQLEECFERRI